MVPLTTRDGKSSRHAWRAGAGLVTATALVVTLAPAAPAAPVAASGPSSLTSSDWQAPEVPPPLEIESTPQLEADEIATVPLAARAPMPLAVPGPAVWPTPGQVPEPTEDPSGSGEWRSAEGVLMLRMSPPSVEPRPGAPVVTVLDRGEAEELGVEGLVMDVEPAAEQPDVTELQVDYSDFADAYGGDWSSRLRVVQLPDCARTTPELDECRTQTPLESTNDPGAQTVTAAITPQTQGLVALAAAPSASSGNWSATPLSASAAWQVSPQTGDFSWSYPMRVVPGLGGPQPELALAYSSGSLDGRVSSTNNQTSWIGDGWDLSTGYIERKYASCADDVENGATNANRTTGDLCWSTDNATMVFDGRATELVKDATTGTWRGKADDGTRIERLTGGFSADDDGEYWRVTTTDGVQYFFGRDKRSASDSLALNSAWTVPVFGNHAGEPCYSSSFASAHCTQTWRWNLDYVVDPSGNSMTYVYEKETNNYGRNLNTGVSSYVRGGYLTRIDYGTRAGAEPEKSPARVTFTVAERCLPSGGVTCAPSQLTSASSSHWPDVPFDLICTSTSSCPTQTSPSFFTRKRLTTVTTSALQESGAYQDVDVWTLTHQFPDPGDGLDPTLWLAGIGHTGRVGDSIALPDVTFHGMQMANRVDRIGDVAPPMNRYRIIAIDTEAGATLSVNYTAPDCSTSSLPSRPDNNSRRCFPVMWSPEGSPDPILEYFHKYLVTSVVADGRDGRSPATETHYSYLDAPAWRYDDNPIVPVKQRTWGDFRGYATVEVFSGSENDPVRSSTRLRFFRGMHGDKIAAGGTRSVSIDGIADVDHLNGFTRQEITYDGVGGAELSRTTSTPWLSSPTATGSDGETARFLGTGTSEARTVAPAAPGGALTTRTVTTFEGAYGLPTQVDDQGDVTLTTDDQCTRIEYVRNTSAHIVATVKRSETVAVTCSATPARPADVVADTRMAYDGKAVGAAPTRGLVTTTQRVADYSGSTPQYVTEATTTYDVHGRVLTATDALGRTATTAYSPATGGLLTSTTSTSPDPDGSGPLTAHATTTDVNPAWGTPTRVTDPNGKVTSAMLDALGRVTGVWLPGRSQGSQTANVTYGYTVSADGRNAVTTSTLGALGSRQTSVQLYDGLLRPTQTQTPSARRNEPGRVITDTVYDSRGLVMVANSAWFHSGSPSTAFVEPVAAVHARTRYEYDGAGRVTAEIFDLRDHEAWRTTTSYGGDRVSVDPPQGGTPQTTISDARGRLTELRQFTGAAPTGEYNATTYAYDKAGRLNQVTDAAGNSWTYTFDLRGRQVATTDPDRGASSSTYDDAGQVLTTTDARGITLAYTRDVLGRQTSLREGSATGTVRASWSYDTLAKGQLTSSTRHVGSAEYVTAVTGYDDGYRPLGQSVTVPDAEGELAGTYTTSYTYTLDGQLKTMRLPAAGGMDEETVTTTYDQLSLPRTLSGGLGWGTYVSDAGYSPYGEPLWMDLNNSSADIVTYSYEQGTRRLQNVAVQRENEPVRDMDVSYTYDQAGNPTSIVDEGRGPVDAQCFEYDGLRRLVQAWTPSSADCGVEPTAAGLGGPAPYWFEDSFDVVGNRVSRVVGGSEGSTSFAYAYPAAGGAGAHQVASVTRTGAQGAGSSSYVYDQAGNTVTREVAGQGTQSLVWDVEGELVEVTGPGAGSFVYTADGDRLVRRQGGAVTVYLPGGQEVTAGPDGAVSAVRYYGLGGRTVASRTDTSAASVRSLVSDAQGTAHLAITTTTGQVTRRYTDPYGNPRGQTTDWVGDRGFLDKPVDASGLSAVGARYYDPTLGRFISVDPVMDLTDPAQWHGYSYANNNPITNSDPTGLLPGAPMIDGQHGSTVATNGYQRQRQREKAKGGGGTGPASAVTKIVSKPTATTYDDLASLYNAGDYDGFRAAWTPKVERMLANDPNRTVAWSMYSDVLEHERVCAEQACAPPCRDLACTLMGMASILSGFIVGPILSRLFSVALLRFAARAPATTAASTTTAANTGTALVKYDADFAVGQLTAGGRATASQLDEFGAAQGWARSQTATGPVKYTDGNGVVRLTIKQGSPRAPGSGGPHVELRNADGARIDPFGNPVSRTSPGNHTPIVWDW